VIAIILLVIIIILIIWAAANHNNNNKAVCSSDSDCPSNQLCVNGKCVVNPHPPCGLLPTIPTGVTATSNELGKSAVISWTASSTATSYTVYAKLNDPGVGKNNYDSKVSTTATTTTFTNLPQGTTYFVVTSSNACGESDASSPAVLASSCNSLPPTPASPAISQDSNDCVGPAAAQFIEAHVTNAGLTNGGYILQGTGQIGAVGNYLVVLPQSSYGPISGITQACTGNKTSHTVIDVANWVEANITSVPPSISGTSYTMTWQPLVGADEYVAFIVGEGPTSFYFFGGFAPGSATSLTIPTQPGLVPTYGVVLAYKLCDKSQPSAPTIWTTPT
jgi:hypothetical protein